MHINLWEPKIPHYNGAFQIGINNNAPTLTPYLLSGDEQRACVIVFSGGGYRDRAEHEGAPVAKWLNSLGFNSFVLNYRVAPYRYPAPMADAQRAIRHVRHNCIQYNVNPNKIGIFGFSAGGHLACVSSILYTSEFYEHSDEIDKISARPNAAVLCYPVISLIRHIHAGSVEELLGSTSSTLKESLSGEMIAHSETPPTFIWHTSEDSTVPVDHSLMLTQALRNKGVPVDCHIFNNGRHGLGIGASPRGGVPLTMQWMDLCSNWLKLRLC